MKIGFVGLLLAVCAVSAAPFVSAEGGAKTPAEARWGTSSAEDTVSADELRKSQVLKENLLILDARGKGTFDAGHIDGAILPLPPQYYKQDELFKQGSGNIPPDSHAALLEAMSRVPKNRKIVTYCNAGCGAAATVAAELRGFGFTNVKVMEEGYQTWQAKGYPVNPRPSAQPPSDVEAAVRQNRNVNEAIKNAKRI